MCTRALQISCPNYTFEILSWVGFNLMTSTLAGIVFLLLGAFQMTQMQAPPLPARVPDLPARPQGYLPVPDSRRIA